MDFKFVTHRQNILLQHMHKKEFWILTNKCGNNLTHKNEAEWPCWQVENSVSRDVITRKVYSLIYTGPLK